MGRFYRAYLMVTDVDASVAFYRDVMGLDVDEREEGRASLGGAGCSLVLEEDFEEETLAAFGLDPPGEQRGDGLILNVRVDDVSAVVERAEAHGAEVLSPPREVDWAGTIALVADPDGYVVEAADEPA